MSALRIALRKCVSMLGGGIAAVVVLLAVCLTAYTLHGVYSARRSDAIVLDAVIAEADDAVAAVCREMGEGGSIVLRVVDGDTATADLLWGRVEGVLTIPEGFARSVMQNEPQFTYRSAPQAASSAYVLERFSSALVAYRIREDSISRRMQEGLARAEAEAQVSAAWESVASEQGAGYAIETSGEGDAIAAGSVFAQAYAKSAGFVAMLLMLLYASMLQWLILEDVRRVSERLDSQRFGRLLGKGTDMLAMLLIGMLTAAVCGLLMGTLSLRYLLYFLSYCVFLSGFFLLLGGVLRADGQVQVFVPFVTLVTSLIGGCLFDLSSVSPVLRRAALFTPQGLLLHAFSSASPLAALVLLVAGAAAFALCLWKPRRMA